MKVLLPEGWTALLGADQVLRAGPPGHPVLRIEPRSGAGEALPTAEGLADRLRAELTETKLSVISRKTQSDASLLRYSLLPLPKPDGGGVGEAVGLLGAKRVGADLFLCSTLPGARAIEMDQAAEACLGLTLSFGG
jgi:hypothetical protein